MLWKARHGQGLGFDPISPAHIAGHHSLGRAQGRQRRAAREANSPGAPPMTMYGNCIPCCMPIQRNYMQMCSQQAHLQRSADICRRWQSLADICSSLTMSQFPPSLTTFGGISMLCDTFFCLLNTVHCKVCSLHQTAQRTGWVHLHIHLR